MFWSFFPFAAIFLLFLPHPGRLGVTVSLKAHLVIFRKLEQFWRWVRCFSSSFFSHSCMCISYFFSYSCPTKDSYANITFLISFYQTKNFQMFKLLSKCLLYKFQSTIEVAVGGPFQGFDDIRKLSLKRRHRTPFVTLPRFS